MQPVDVAIALGSNLGDRRAHLDFAVAALRRVPGASVLAVAPAIETPPVGPAGQGAYLNAAVLLRTTMPADAVLWTLLGIERARGRRRGGPRWGPRTLDLDLLLHGSAVVVRPGLTVPHPRMHERRFVLEPLAAIAPELVHPVLGRSISELLGTVDDLARPTAVA